MQSKSDQFFGFLDAMESEMFEDSVDNVVSDNESCFEDKYSFIQNKTQVKYGKNKGTEKCTISLVSENFTFKRKYNSKNGACIFSCNACQKIRMNVNAKAIEHNAEYTL